MPQYRYGFSPAYLCIGASTCAVVGFLALFDDGHRGFSLLFWLFSFGFLWAGRNNRSG
jgi:hypothetical protein